MRERELLNAADAKAPQANPAEKAPESTELESTSLSLYKQHRDLTFGSRGGNRSKSTLLAADRRLLPHGRQAPPPSLRARGRRPSRLHENRYLQRCGLLCFVGLFQCSIFVWLISSSECPLRFCFRYLFELPSLSRGEEIVERAVLSAVRMYFERACKFYRFLAAFISWTGK